jgi:hypothetical protein
VRTLLIQFIKLTNTEKIIGFSQMHRIFYEIKYKNSFVAISAFLFFEGQHCKDAIGLRYI